MTEVAEQGFEAPETILRLDFTDPSFDGLVVRARAARWSNVERMADLADVDVSEPLPLEARATIADSISAFAASLVEWNLRRRGEPVPANREGVASLEVPWVWQLVAAWIDGTKRALAAQLAAQRLSETELPMEFGD